MKNCISNLFCCAVTAALAFLSETGVGAQIGGVPLWTNYYGGEPALSVFPSALAVDASGNVFLAGTVEADFVTVKYSGAGVLLWTNRFNRGPGNTAEYTPAVAIDSYGNAFVTGRTFDFGCETLKYSGAGVPLWTNYLDAEIIEDVAVDNTGKVFVAGSTTQTNTGNYITVAYSNGGLPLWTNYYNGPENLTDNVRDVAVDGNGNVIVTGSAAGSIATIKYSGAGVPLWTNRYVGGVAHALGVDGSGNVFVTGSSGLICTTIKYSGAGVALWTNVFNKGNSESPQALAIDSSGNICVATSAVNSSSGSNDFLTLKYSGAGVPLWTNRYNTPQNLWDEARAIGVDANGNVFVHGDANFTLFGTDYTAAFTTIAYSSEGVLLWANRYAESSSLGGAEDLAVDGSGNVVVTGFSGRGGNPVCVTIKYSSALPRLTINRTATNTVVVSWPSLLTNFALQQNTNLNHALNWSNIIAGVQDNGTNKTLIVNPTSGNRFYRLNKPQ